MREKLVRGGKNTKQVTWFLDFLERNILIAIFLAKCKKIFKKLSKFVFTFESFTSVDVRSSN